IAHEVARAMREGKATTGVVAVPRAGLQGDQIMTEVEVNRNAFTLGPFAIRIEQEWSWLGRRILSWSRHVDWLLSIHAMIYPISLRKVSCVFGGVDRNWGTL